MVHNRMYTDIVHFMSAWANERIPDEYIINIYYMSAHWRKDAGGGENARICKTMNKEWWWLMIECKTVTRWLQGDEM